MTKKTRKASRKSGTRSGPKGRPALPAPRKAGRTPPLEGGPSKAIKAALGIHEGALLRRVDVTRQRKKAGVARGLTSVRFSLLAHSAPIPVALQSSEAKKWMKVYEDADFPDSFSVDVRPGRTVHVAGKAQQTGADSKALRFTLQPGGWLYVNGQSPGLLMGVERTRQGTFELGTWEANIATQNASEDLKRITNDFGAERWLVDAAEALVLAGGPYAPFVGMGLLGRLWSGRDARAIERLEAGDSPAKRVRDWWRLAPEQDRRNAVTAARGEVGSLLDTIQSIRELRIENSPLAVAIAQACLERRDDLESLAFLAGDEARDLRHLLDALDRRVASELAVLSDALRSARQTDRLAAVRWMEPDAWWGQPW